MAILQLIINGIALGAFYALVTLGFVFVINATGAVNFAQGELVMAGGYAADRAAAADPSRAAHPRGRRRRHVLRRASYSRLLPTFR